MPTDSSMPDLEVLERLLADVKATANGCLPWSICDSRPEGNPYWNPGRTIHADGVRIAELSEFRTDRENDAIGQLLVAAVNALPALTSLAREQEWRPISEAPGDGTKVLVTRSPHTGKQPPTKIAWRFENNPDPRWRIGLNKRLHYAPTHFMPLRPLPTPPNEVEHA